MPLSNPSQTEKSNESVLEKESVLLEWIEPGDKSQLFSSVSISKTLTIAILGTILCIVIAIWKSYYPLYLAALACILVGISLIAQKKRPAQPLRVVITTGSIVVGNSVKRLEDIAGFWLEKEGEMIIVNIEPAKPSFVPISVSFPASTQDEARSVLSQVLPEVEPRIATISDQINKYFRF